VAEVSLPLENCPDKKAVIVFQWEAKVFEDGLQTASQGKEDLPQNNGKESELADKHVSMSSIQSHIEVEPLNASLNAGQSACSLEKKQEKMKEEKEQEKEQAPNNLRLEEI